MQNAMFGPPSAVPRDIFYNGTAAFAPLSFAVSERCKRRSRSASYRLWPSSMAGMQRSMTSMACTFTSQSRAILCLPPHPAYPVPRVLCRPWSATRPTAAVPCGTSCSTAVATAPPRTSSTLWTALLPQATQSDSCRSAPLLQQYSIDDPARATQHPLAVNDVGWKRANFLACH